MIVTESDDYNAAFPARRIAHVTLVLKDGRQLTSPPTEARFDPEHPVGDAEVREKFHTLADPCIGAPKALAIERVVAEMGAGSGLADLFSQLHSRAASKDRVSEKT